MKLSHIEKALKKGSKMHGFRSGGGLRVIRIEGNGKLKGYGEHPNVEDALSHANEDLSFGGRIYNAVYGVIKPHYLTGSSHTTSSLDEWLYVGNSFDAFVKGGEVVVELRGYSRLEGSFDQVVKTGTGTDFFQALEKAVVSPEVKVAC